MRGKFFHAAKIMFPHQIADSNVYLFVMRSIPHSSEWIQSYPCSMCNVAPINSNHPEDFIQVTALFKPPPKGTVFCFKAYGVNGTETEPVALFDVHMGVVLEKGMIFVGDPTCHIPILDLDGNSMPFAKVMGRANMYVSTDNFDELCGLKFIILSVPIDLFPRFSRPIAPLPNAVLW